jgi:hypothetical protein
MSIGLVPVTAEWGYRSSASQADVACYTAKELRRWSLMSSGASHDE